MSDEIPKAQRWTGETRMWAVVSGGHIEATFLGAEDAHAYAAYLTEVGKTYSSHSTPYSVSEVPKPSKLSLAIEPVAARSSSEESDDGQR